MEDQEAERVCFINFWKLDLIFETVLCFILKSILRIVY